MKTYLFSFALAASLAIVYFIWSKDSGKKYYSIIAKASTGPKALVQDTFRFSAIDDTSAFKVALQDYWSSKLAALTTNKELQISADMPFIFELYDSKGSLVHIDERQKEKLSAWMLDYAAKKIKAMDTLKPFISTDTEKRANIY